MSPELASGDMNLQRMLATLELILADDDYVFCVVNEVPGGATPFATIQELEGVTLVLPRQQADALSLKYNELFARITLSVHSSLMAVGLTAAVANALSEQNISANVIAAYYHDHVLVPKQRSQEALAALEQLRDQQHTIGA